MILKDLTMLVEPNCGHTLEYRLKSSCPGWEEQAAPVKCPDCERDDDMIACGRCGKKQGRESVVTTLPEAITPCPDCVHQ